MADAYYYQGDTLPDLRTTLRRAGVVIDLTNKTVQFDLYRKGREAYEAPVVSGMCADVDAPNGMVEYQWGANDLDRYGNFSGIFTIIDGGDAEGIPDGGYVTIVVRPAATT